MKRIYLILIAAVAITFTSCSDRDMDTVKPDTGQGAPIINLPEGASQGKIMVKFKPEAASFLDAAVTRSIGGAMTRSGISDMDVILKRIGTHKLERIFPIDNRTEERTRKAGLNLWYVIHFDEDTNLEHEMELFGLQVVLHGTFLISQLEEGMSFHQVGIGKLVIGACDE